MDHDHSSSFPKLGLIFTLVFLAFVAFKLLVDPGSPGWIHKMDVPMVLSPWHMMDQPWR